MLRFFKTSSLRIFVFAVCIGLAALQLASCGSRQDRAKSHYQQGMNYLEKKDFVKARIEFRNALQLDGKMLEAWRALAQVDEHNNSLPDLVGDLRHIAELDSRDVATRVQLAKILISGNAGDQALTVVNEADAIDPQNATILAIKANVLFRLDDKEGALKTAQKAIEIDPASTDARIALASIKYYQDDFNGALKILADVPKKNEDDLGILRLKVNIFNRLGDDQQAETLLRRLITLHPKEQQFRNMLISFYLQHKRQDDAIKELRDFTVVDPSDTNAELALVNLLNAVKGSAAASAELAARVKAGGPVFPYQIALAKIDAAQGKFEDAKALLDKLISGSKESNDVATARITLAELYVQRNDVASAEPLVSEILKTDSRNTDGLRLRASIAMAHNRLDDAIGDLRTALNNQPQSPVLLSNLGSAYERQGSIELADKMYADATKASGYSPQFGLNYVQFLLRHGMTGQAENVLTSVSNYNRNSISVLSALAQIKLYQKEWAAAESIAKLIQRLSDKPELSDVINAAAFAGENKISDSISALRRVYNADPKAVPSLIALTAAYLKTNQIDSAEAVVQPALKGDPDNAEIIVLNGLIALAKNKPDQAVQEFKDAIKKKPKAPAGYIALERFYVERKKDLDAAIQVTRDAIKEIPGSFDLRLTLTILLEAKKDYEAAIAEYESMLKDNPGSMIVANNLASLLSNYRTDTASLDRAKSLVRLLAGSPVPNFKDTVGWIDYQSGDYKAALSLLEEAAEKLPNSPLVHYHLGMNYLATDQDKKALEQFEKARALAPNDAELNVKINTATKNRPNRP